MTSSDITSHSHSYRERTTELPDTSSNIKNEKQYEALKDKGMSKERAAKIANDPDSKGGKASGSGKKKSDSSQGGTTAQKKKAGRKGGKATASKSRSTSTSTSTS